MTHGTTTDSQPSAGGDVTVVVVSRNRRDDLLASLPRHEAPVVLMDNASTDDTVQAVRSAHPEVTVLALPTNEGARARTLGAAEAGTPFVAFADRSRYSMDWYYPVLAGAVTGGAARERLAAGWDRFVVPGLGARCVADRPWVTGAETCELALALVVAGQPEAACEQVAAMQHLRHDDGSYWTGLVYADDARWPVERTTWTAAAVLLAADALSGATPASALFADPAALPAPGTRDAPGSAAPLTGRPQP